MSKKTASIVLCLCISGLMLIQNVDVPGHLILAGEIGLASRHAPVEAHAVLGAVGIVSEAGIAAAGIMLAVNPWLAAGVVAGYGL